MIIFAGWVSGIERIGDREGQIPQLLLEFRDGYTLEAPDIIIVPVSSLVGQDQRVAVDGYRRILHLDDRAGAEVGVFGLPGAIKVSVGLLKKPSLPW